MTLTCVAYQINTVAPRKVITRYIQSCLELFRLYISLFAFCEYIIRILLYQSADKSLARPTPSRCILLDGDISFDASVVLHI